MSSSEPRSDDKSHVSESDAASSNHDVDAMEKGQTPEEAAATKKWVNLLKVIFIITGCSELFYWNSVLNILDPLRTQIYSDYPWVSDTLNGCNNVTSLLVVIYSVKTGAMNQKVIVGSGIMLGLCCLATAMTAQWAEGLAGVIVLHIINVIAGAASGFFQTGGFGLAAVMPVSMTGYVSTGQGVCGILTWFIWYFVGTLAYPNPTQKTTRISCWILMSLGTAALAFACVTYVWLLNKPDVKARVAKVTKALKEEATNPDAPSYRYLFKQVWMLIVTIWMCMFASLFVFPTIGPLHWNDSATWIQWTFFAFQIGDLIGRYLPNIIEFVLIPIVPLFWTNVGRVILVPTLSVLCWKLPNTAFFNSPVFHVILMFALAVTNGWFISCVYINSPYAIKQEDWRSRVTSMIILGLTVGISSGLWFAKVLLVTAM